jgi:5-hmdU DNA kinase, helical domain
VTTPPDLIVVAGRCLSPTQVFDTYWCFAAARQEVYQARLRGDSGPWTQDPILATYRFTNCYRAADRVSQYLIKEVIYRGDQDAEEVLFRILLFRFFNRITTWELLASALGGELTWAKFRLDHYDAVLSEAFSRAGRIYTPAYVIPSPSFGALRKHTNHLRLLEHMLRGGLRCSLQAGASMREVFDVLRS